jgi:hypothetical protein
VEPTEPVTAAMLREFVLTIDLKLEQLRTEMHTEFGKVHATLARLETVGHEHSGRFDRLEGRLGHIDNRLLFTALTAGIALAGAFFALLR